MNRWIVQDCYNPAIGWLSEIMDVATNRRILVAGDDHRARAEKRAAELNGEAESTVRALLERRS